MSDIRRERAQWPRGQTAMQHTSYRDREQTLALGEPEQVAHQSILLRQNERSWFVLWVLYVQNIETRLGQLVAYLVHDQATGNGDNTDYRITAKVFGRVMDVWLQGAASSRGVWLQPVAYFGAGVVVASTAPSSNGETGTLALVR